MVVRFLLKAMSFFTRIGTTSLYRCMWSYGQSGPRIGWCARNTLGFRAKSLERLAYGVGVEVSSWQEGGDDYFAGWEGG